MKKTDLERMKEARISSMMAQTVTPGRFGREAAELVNRREQRKLDQAKGLIPFAVKLHGDLIRRLHGLAQERATGLNEITEELLRLGLGMPQPVVVVPEVRAVPTAPPVIRNDPPPAPVSFAASVPSAMPAKQPPPVETRAPVVAAPSQKTAASAAPQTVAPAKKPAAKAPAAKTKAPVAKAKAPAAKTKAPAKKTKAPPAKKAAATKKKK